MQRVSALLMFCFVSFAIAEWVVTPFGRHPTQCVHHVAEDEVASFDDTDELFRS